MVHALAGRVEAARQMGGGGNGLLAQGHGRDDGLDGPGRAQQVAGGRLSRGHRELVGGITEETTVMGVPCMTLRDNTERPETVTTGTNELIGTNPDALEKAIATDGESLVKGLENLVADIEANDGELLVTLADRELLQQLSHRLGRPLNLSDAPNHPAFAYRPETGEDPYHAFLAVPLLRGGFVESNDPNGPYGAKGASETAILPGAPAIANAVFDAVGVRIVDLPITPEKVLAALKAQSASGVSHA